MTIYYVYVHYKEKIEALGDWDVYIRCVPYHLLFRWPTAATVVKVSHRLRNKVRFVDGAGALTDIWPVDSLWQN